MPSHRATNAFRKADRIVERVREELLDGDTGYGWDARQDVYRDLLTEPMVIDPVLVVTSALQSAVSVATTLLMAEAVITPKASK
jgi:chaperonin GroEL (HSP60 family)